MVFFLFPNLVWSETDGRYLGEDGVRTELAPKDNGKVKSATATTTASQSSYATLSLDVIKGILLVRFF